MGILSNKKKVGLALGGGAVLGTAHIGVLKALVENSIPIDLIAGTSIGALVAALYAFNIDYKELENTAKELDWFDITSISLSKFGLLKNDKLGKIVIDKIGDVTFDNAKIELAIIATDISNGKKVVLKNGNVDKAVMASTALPGIFAPVEIENKLLVDGGIVENLPIKTLKDMGADYIIGIDLSVQHYQKKPENIIEVLINSFDFTIINATKFQLEEADFLIKPNLKEFNMIDTDQIEDLIKEGYNAANKVINQMI